MEVVEEVCQEHLGVGDVESTLFEMFVLALDDLASFLAEVDSPALRAKGDDLSVLGDRGFLHNVVYLFSAADTFCCDDEFTVHVCREFLFGFETWAACFLCAGYDLGGVGLVVVEIIVVVSDIDVNPSKSFFGLCLGSCCFRNCHGL